MSTTRDCSFVRLAWFGLAFSAAAMPGAAWGQGFPAFTNPTNITNPFYPVSNNKQSITLGVSDGEPFRSEVTRMPTTRAVTWSGGTTQTQISQYVAYLNGDLVEVAYDYFAQADNGDLYYFGEDVFNYQDGVVVNTNGTWLAGRDGAPPGLIMPAHPAVGNVFHPENFRPLVWEEDTVVSLMEPTRTPMGAIGNGLLIHELLLDDTEEMKTYASGYGQVAHSEDGASTHLAVFNRVNAATGRVPESLSVLEWRAAEVLKVVPSWRRARTQLSRINARWNGYRAQAVSAGAPTEYITAMDQFVADLNTAVQSRNIAATQEAAGDLRTAALDLINFYNPRVPADIKTLDLLERELRLDAQGGEWAEVALLHAKAADVVWARLKPFIVRRAGGAVIAQELDRAFAAQATASRAHRPGATINAAHDAIDAVGELDDLY